MTEAAHRSVAALPSALVCSGCGERIRDDGPLALACPAARPGDDIDHVLVRVLDPAARRLAEDVGAPNPYVRWRRRFHAYHRARAAGWSDADYVALVERLDAAVARADGRGDGAASGSPRSRAARDCPTPSGSPPPAGCG